MITSDSVLPLVISYSPLSGFPGKEYSFLACVSHFCHRIQLRQQNDAVILMMDPLIRRAKPLDSSRRTCYRGHFAMQQDDLVSDSEAIPSPARPSKEVLKSALKAFRKRLKLTQLADESRLTYGPMSGGGQSGVVAITPPDQFPREVWEELAKQTKLKHVGGGLYELVGS